VIVGDLAAAFAIGWMAHVGWREVVAWTVRRRTRLAIRSLRFRCGCGDLVRIGDLCRRCKGRDSWRRAQRGPL